jgi:carbon monoxide dehydrogenase subunit G
VRIDGTEVVSIPRAMAWRGVTEPELLRACTPGLSRLDETTPGHFDAVLELTLPAVNGRFEGSVDVLERDEPNRVKMRIKGKGAPGFVDGTAEIKLEDAPNGGTKVVYVADVQIGGQVARLGQRMIFGATREMAGQFFEALERHYNQSKWRAEQAAANAPKPRGAFFAGLQLAWRLLLNRLGLSRRS